MARLTLLVETEPWLGTFLGNLWDTLWPRRQAGLNLSSAPGTFWPDVFVDRRLPWRRFLQSWIYEVLLVCLVLGLWRILPHRPSVVARSVFSRSDVIYYEPSEYLPPLDTGGARAQVPQPGAPVYAQQPIISVPAEPDNRRQTIIAPPSVKIDRDVPLPNMVAWSGPQPAVPMAATSLTPRRAPVLTTDVVAPAPEIDKVYRRTALVLQQQVVAPAPSVNFAVTREKIGGLQSSVIAPPPVVQAAQVRRTGDINIARAEAVAPAPSLPMVEQRTASTKRVGIGLAGGGAVPPPPSIAGGTRAARGGGRLIALSVNPAAPKGPVDTPGGNRRGTFAATPQGKPGATGAPGASGGGQSAQGLGRTGKDNGAGQGGPRNGVPPGIFVGAGATQSSSTGNSSDQTLTANARPPRSGRTKLGVSPIENPTPLEQKVFGTRRSYSMTLNMPNLNSAGGSWVIHFAELKDYGSQGDLLPPVATQKVDPGYPLDLARRQIQGTVTLRAIIHDDGHVSDIQVLQGVDERLDDYACKALARWRFIPAEKDGKAVALQAVVMIPFKLVRFKSGF